MFVDAEKMPDDSRIWIYQSSRAFTSEEVIKISDLAIDFLNSWTAHNKELKASFEIRYHMFLIIMIDSSYTQASGCSIDKSLHFIQKLEKDFIVNLLDRQMFAIREGDKINLVRRNDFEKLIEKEISKDSIVFNNLIQTKKELDSSWEIPIKDSWHGALLMR